MIEHLQRLVAWLMNRVRVNDVQLVVLDGVPWFVKRRRTGGTIIVWFGNRFLRLARSGVCMFVRVTEWVDWEVYCAQLLYPNQPDVKVGAGASVILPPVRGMSLRDLLRHPEADITAFHLAARELRRVHQIDCSHYQAKWSHGDLHLDNLIYDALGARVVLIDFDTRHEFHLGQLQRHSDDLKVVLLELLGLPKQDWLPLATAFLDGYGEITVLKNLNCQLVVPRGLAKILWFTRTNCASWRQIEERLQVLRKVIDQLVARSKQSSGTDHCHDTSRSESNCLQDCSQSD